jgi:hypothetical protein
MIDTLKIENSKIRRFILLESDYSVNIMGKFLFYLAVLPEDISLMRNVYQEFPDDDVCMFKSHLNLQW